MWLHDTAVSVLAQMPLTAHRRPKSMKNYDVNELGANIRGT
jgi:phage terminase Nu1 subunit (DNA packaging protein)